MNKLAIVASLVMVSLVGGTPAHSEPPSTYDGDRILYGRELWKAIIDELNALQKKQEAYEEEQAAVAATATAAAATIEDDQNFVDPTKPLETDEEVEEAIREEEAGTTKSNTRNPTDIKKPTPKAGTYEGRVIEGGDITSSTDICLDDDGNNICPPYEVIKKPNINKRKQ